jgi:hypothetical protein
MKLRVNLNIASASGEHEDPIQNNMKKIETRANLYKKQKEINGWKFQKKIN